ncbi:GTPase IMAP family member 4-like [Alosa alosa]|uniref:GTPase IMAP family member 4-like n=1 Tax=Alosa alosa TaxID=278164 RepID=UPI0020150936|nr:GTPase IMAP family member 4-like [Alosa alosa]
MAYCDVFTVRRESPGPALPVSAAVSELRLVLLGGSTSGKRAAGDLILGTDTSTETQHSEKRQEEVAGRRVTVVDTPDWFCSGLSEKDMRQDVGRCVRLSAPGPHAFLLVMPMKPSEGEEKRMRKKMEDIFREGCWGHTLILFTHTGRLSEKRVEELLQTGSKELRQLVEKCENRYHLLNIKDRPDDTEITQLLEKIDKMVSGNRKKFYSSETYEDAERQRTDIERRIEKEWRSRGVGEKSTELEKLLLEQRELERENGRMEDMLYEKDREIERMRLKLKESGISTT